MRCGAREKNSPFFENAFVLVRVDHIAPFIVNAGDGVMSADRKTQLPQPATPVRKHQHREVGHGSFARVTGAGPS
jgi:hypothetical protein